MNKEIYRKYLLSISSYLNIFAICKFYNMNNEIKVDYNNLRTFIKDKKNCKISEEKLETFIYFIKQNIALNIVLEENKEKHIIKKVRNETKRDIIDIIKNSRGEKNEI